MKQKLTEWEKAQATIENMTTLELAHVLDDILQICIVEFDPKFEVFYQGILHHLKEYDCMDVLKKRLIKAGKKFSNYQKKVEKEKRGLKYQENIYFDYMEWKKGIGDNYIISFADDCKEVLKEKYPEIRNDITSNYICELVRREKKRKKQEKKNDGKKVTVNIEVKKPELKDSDLEKKDLNVENIIDVSRSKKNSKELLAILEKANLIYLANEIMETLGDKNTDHIQIFLHFGVCQMLHSGTSGKEYSRTDKQIIKNPSKTKSMTYEALYDDCVKRIKELNVLYC